MRRNTLQQSALCGASKKLPKTRFISVGNAGTLRRWMPAMDLVEEDDHFVLSADLPGVEEKDINVELEDNVLTISGERKSEHEDRKEGYYRIERSSGRFSRTLTLPDRRRAEGA